MRNNQPVTQREHPLSGDEQLISTTDLKSIITSANNAFVSVSGFTRDELVGSPHNLVRHPDMPEGSADGIIKGMYLLRDSGLGTRDSGKGKGKSGKDALCVQLMGSGTILREVIAAAELLEKDFGVKADVWSCPSFTELARDGEDATRHNRLHPDAKSQRKPYVTQLLEGRQGPAIAATDYVRTFANQVREFVPMRYVVLGTDGFGRSDTRANLRRHFEVDRNHVAHAAVDALVKDGKLAAKDAARAIKLYKIDADKPNPLHA